METLLRHCDAHAMHFLQTSWTLTNILIQCIQQGGFQSRLPVQAPTPSPPSRRGGTPCPHCPARWHAFPHTGDRRPKHFKHQPSPACSRVGDEIGLEIVSKEPRISGEIDPESCDVGPFILLPTELALPFLDREVLRAIFYIF